jgi:thioesterase domain-containing protein
MAYRRLAQRLESRSPLIGITPPSLEHLAAPHTIEHVASECVRMLERYRPNGPYAFAGWRSEGLVALEMARILEERGEKVAFVALLDAAELFSAGGMLGRLWRSFGRKAEPSSCEYMADALRRYKPRPWAGKILHVRAGAEKRSGQAWFEWRDIAPQGVASFEAPAEMFAEPNVATVAGILATALGHIPDCDNRRSESRTRNA